MCSTPVAARRYREEKWTRQSEGSVCAISQKLNTADFDTKMLRETRLRALRAACGIVALAERMMDALDMHEETCGLETGRVSCWWE